MEEFKLIIAGGRDFKDYEYLSRVVMDLAHKEYPDKAISIVSGMAKGADALGYLFSIRHNIVRYQFPAQWNQYGRAAGYLRNVQMGDFADGLLAFWDQKSRGTRHMIEYMNKLHKPVHIAIY